jgi:tRNA dimethylallyltransferase
MPMADHAVREKLQHRFQQHGLPDLLAELDRLDPTISTVIDRNNPQRVIRALEVCIVSGKPFSAQHKGHRQRTDIRVLRIAMDVPRTELYANIDARVDQMIADGLEEEVRSLLPHRELNALRTVGYREFFEHFDGKLSREAAIELIKQHTRNYAKRQMTWLRREKAWKWTKPDDLERIKQFIDEAL